MSPPASTSALCVKIDGSRFFAARPTSRARWGMNTGSVTTNSAPARSLAIAAKAPSKVPGPACFHELKLQPQRPRRSLDVAYGERLDGTVRVREDSNAPDLW